MSKNNFEISLFSKKNLKNNKLKQYKEIHYLFKNGIKYGNFIRITIIIYSFRRYRFFSVADILSGKRQYRGARQRKISSICMYSEQQFINKYSKSELISYTDFHEK